MSSPTFGGLDHRVKLWRIARTTSQEPDEDLVDPTTEHPNIALMRQVFAWFNSLAHDDATVSHQQVQHWFATDAEMITNGRLKCRGIASFVRHFEEIRQKLSDFAVLPIKDVIADDHSAAAVYDIRYRLAGGPARDSHIHACVFWSFASGKVAKLNEWVYFEGEQLSLDEHT